MLRDKCKNHGIFAIQKINYVSNNGSFSVCFEK